MRIKLSLFFLILVIFNIQITPMAFSQSQGNDKNSLTFNQYNLRVKIPPTWISLPVRDVRCIVSLVSDENQRIKDTRYHIFISKLTKNLSIDDLIDRSAKEKAYQVLQHNLIKLGKQEEVDVAGLKGREDMFLFSVGGYSFMYAIVGFEKNGMGYILDFWSLRNSKSKMAFERFRNWLKNGVSFIDSSKDIDANVKLQLQQIGAKSSAKDVIAMNVETNPDAIQSVVDFGMASPDTQKRYMEENLPADTEIHRLSKQAMLAEHAGEFSEAKKYYEAMLSRKEEVIAAYQESGWVMLHPAIQRTSEMTGDEAREKEMLIWINKNMLSDQGTYHKYLNGLLPNVQAHLKERVKKFNI